MANVTAPYCHQADVAFFLTMVRGGQGVEFSATSSPSEDVVQELIAMIASRIDMAYMSVGYIIPFTVISGETWLSGQTDFLKYANVIGTAAYMGGNVASPPVTAPGRPRPSGSLYWEEWNKLIDEIKMVGEKSDRPTLALLRAQTRSGTGANWRLSTSQPMTTDFLEGFYDPTQYDMMHGFTERTKDFYQDMADLAPESPDYLWLMHQRLGLTYYAD